MTTRSGTLRVRVDADACQGHNRCHALAPQLFDIDDEGQAVVVGNGIVPRELEDKARRAAANCPEHAVAVDPANDELVR